MDSWKAIASYLNRDLRTVQRWEKEEGLPVWRHPHLKASSVHASKAQIEEWRRNRALRVDWAVKSQSALIRIGTSGQLEAETDPARKEASGSFNATPCAVFIFYSFPGVGELQFSGNPQQNVSSLADACKDARADKQRGRLSDGL